MENGRRVNGEVRGRRKGEWELIKRGRQGPEEEGGRGGGKRGRGKEGRKREGREEMGGWEKGQVGRSGRSVGLDSGGSGRRGGIRRAGEMRDWGRFRG